MKKVGNSYRLAGVALALASGTLACGLDSLPGGLTGGDDSGALFRDAFSDSGSGWDTYSDEYGSVAYVDDELAFEVLQEQSIIQSIYTEEEFRDVRVSVSVTVDPDVTDPGYAILCGFRNFDNYYSLGFGKDGYYAITKVSNGDTTVLTYDNNEWIQSDDIETDKKTYALEAVCANGELELLVDGVSIAKVEDGSFPSGDVGLAVLTFTEPHARATFDDLKVLEAGKE